jgi:hypothetical protein
MRRILVVVGMLAVLAIPATALAVDLQSSQVGTTCAHGGSWHFVANEVNGAVGSLTVHFSGGTVNAGVAVKHNQGTNQWTIDGFGTLLGATATVGSKLVLSDYTCFAKKG